MGLKKIGTWLKDKVKRFKNFFRRLLTPIYLFPVKLVSYSLFYLGKLILTIIKKIFRMFIWPFRSWKNLFRTLLCVGILTYVAFNEIRWVYIYDRFGGFDKFFCNELQVTEDLKNKVVRVVGGYSEGSGFFINSLEVLTNFHVIDGEPSPKVIFPDGTFATVFKIRGDKDADLAILTLGEFYFGFSLDFAEENSFVTDEPLISAGYAYGTDLSGEASVLRGRFTSLREPKDSSVDYIQSDINVVEGMSGGPLVDQCGKVVGVNTLSLSGLSLFISSDSVQELKGEFTDQDISRIEVDASVSPEEAVNAYYVYLKARRMEDGFALLSQRYLEKTNFEEWTTRFRDILDVEVIKTEPVEGTDDTVFIKFSTKNWVDGEVEYHHYEGTWETVFEGGVYKMLRSKIMEVEDPDYEWFYE